MNEPKLNCTVFCLKLLGKYPYLNKLLILICFSDLIETIVAVAESTADELTISDGREVKLEEDVQLQLPFLLPEEGYSSDIIRGVPPGLQEFLEPLCGTGK